MPEITKTLIFVAAAAVVGVLAFALRPPSFEPPELTVDDKLFGEIEDATVAEALEIARYDEDTSEVKRLKVAREGGGWVIASHNNYPADASDAKERIQEAALTLMDLTIIDEASTTTTDHALYGVISPESDQVREANVEDIGMFVALDDEQGRAMAKLIVGKPVQGRQGQRFVRKDGDPKVYVARIDVDKLSSNFSDWIEADLLGITSSDIAQLTLKDYDADLTAGLRPDGRLVTITQQDPRYEMVVDWDQDASKWKLQEFLERRGQQMAPSKLTDDEQLNNKKLNDVKTAIDNLEIVDVESKPKELLAGIKSDADMFSDQRLQGVLISRGFFPARGELLGSKGEVRAQTDDGVEYILRFGNEAGIEGGKGDGSQTKLNRYLLVSARVAENQFQPQLPPTMPPTGDDLDDPAGEPLSGAGGQTGDEGQAGDEAVEENASPDAESPPDGEDNPISEAEQPPTDDTPPADSPDEDAPPSDSDNPAADEDEPSADDDPAAAEMAEKRKKAEEKVEELNKKFSKWFYVVSEDVYKKLRVGRLDLIEQKEGSSFGLDELDGLGNPLPPRGEP